MIWEQVSILVPIEQNLVLLLMWTHYAVSATSLRFTVKGHEHLKKPALGFVILYDVLTENLFFLGFGLPSTV